LDER
jgi:hypothetical protein